MSLQLDDLMRGFPYYIQHGNQWDFLEFNYMSPARIRPGLWLYFSVYPEDCREGLYTTVAIHSRSVQRIQRAAIGLR